MARKARAYYQGAAYHVIQRGNNKEYVFDSPGEKDYLVRLLRNAVEVDGAEIFAYVVMNNHFHLALRSSQKTLSTIMHRLNTTYSVFYNFKKKRTGHVFQGRYTAIPILDDNYLLAVIRYIHRNPVKAHICSRVEDYLWSSDYNYRSINPDFVEVGLPLDILANDRNQAREAYRSFVCRDDDIEWEDFLYINEESVAEAIAMPKKISDKEQNVSELLDQILWRAGVPAIDIEAIKSGSRLKQLTPYKIAFAREAFRQGYNLKQIGQHINVSNVAIHHYLYR